MQSVANDRHQKRTEDERTGSDAEDAALYSKEAIAATFLKIDCFHDKLSAIRQQLAGRRQEQLRSQASFDVLRCSNNGENAVNALERAVRTKATAPYEPIRLPVLSAASRPTRVTEPWFDGRTLSMDALRSRASAQSQFDAASDRLQRAEQEAASSVEVADRLTEQARIAMVLYAQNERSWNFDERAKRYQHVMQAKKVADAARLKADDDRVAALCLRGQLVDPLAECRSQSSEGRSRPRNTQVLDPIVGVAQEMILLWILASPLLTLPFTPRDSTPGQILAGEKELSTHVVYYAAPSAMNIGGSEDESTLDMPPMDGWLRCTNHGAMPPPCLTPAKSSIETWLVSGAGAAHLNGKYMFSGTHNGARKFKSAAGVELFRKVLPKTSSIVQGLLDSESRRDLNLTAETPIDVSGSQSSDSRLPSTLQALEGQLDDFKSMEKVGAWMSMDELEQKRRRQRDAELCEKSAHRDGDRVREQESNSKRRDQYDVVASRKGASAELCREWILFSRCSRRVDQLSSTTTSRPQTKGLGCLKRHYYVSLDEKHAMTTWAQEQEAWLEKAALTAIIKREACIVRVERSCQECMAAFQQDLREETQASIDVILKQLNQARLFTVKVLEAIEAWRVHARKRGFARYEAAGDEQEDSSALGWSASITVETGKKLFKGSRPFVSKFKRFCRPEDSHGQQERRLVYLGFFATRDEAEAAYDEFASAEARRLNTTASHLPRRRNVFRSCGKHFAVESERLGPEYCIECAAKQLSSLGGTTEDGSGVDDWNPPFSFSSGENYILKMANDLDFLDQVAPLKLRLSFTHPDNSFPLLGNIFLLPKTPTEDPDMAFFASVCGSGIGIPRLREVTNNQIEDEDHDAVFQEGLDVDRLSQAQQTFLQEVQIYHPDMFSQLSSANGWNQTGNTVPRLKRLLQDSPDSSKRIVQALYWDRCAALCIRQERAPHPFKQVGVWCRHEEGEWASLLVRGKHQQHDLFENQLAKAGKEMQDRRKKALHTIRTLLKRPLYLIPSRSVIEAVIAEGEHVRGDVVLLEVKSAYKHLEKYKSWCIRSVVIQRWYRGLQGRRRARATKRALNLACLTRRRYLDAVSQASHWFYAGVLKSAVRSTTKRLRRPNFVKTVRIDGEQLVISIHSTNSIPPTYTHAEEHASMSIHVGGCASCAQRNRSAVAYDGSASAFRVGSLVCCCILNNPVKYPGESWIIRAYNPHRSFTYRMVLGNDLLYQLLHNQRSPPEEETHRPLGRKPLSDHVFLVELVDHTTNYVNYIESLARSARDNSINWRILSNDAVQRRKTGEVDLERTRERVGNLTNQLQVAIGDARRALDFTSRPFDVAQAWDPIENANNWRLLVQKRRIQKELASATDEADLCRFELFQAVASENFLRAQSAQARSVYESYWRPLLEEQRTILNARTIELEKIHAETTRAMHSMCVAAFALRDTFCVPTRRTLIVAPTIWRRDDVALARLLKIDFPGLQRGRNTMCRQAVLLSNRAQDEVQRRCKRLIVDVSAWTSQEKRKVWVSAYDPVVGHTQRIYLDWELVQLLATAAVVRSTGASERSRWAKIADKLLSLCMLDRFTGRFTLQKLQFYHRLRLLRPQFLSSRWFQDVQRGRKCGDGDEILREAAMIEGKACFIVVYENWGDLVVRAYRTSCARSYRVQIGIRSIFALLAAKPLALHLWISCVKSNQYIPSIITTITSFLRFAVDSDELVMPEIDASHECSTPLVSLSTVIQGRRVLVKYRQSVQGDLDIAAYEPVANRNYRLLLDWDNVRRARQASQNKSVKSHRQNLALKRNRRELCEWITSRLRFQSLLDHPDVLASSTSPLIHGMQVRKSFFLFNAWVSTSVRIPLAEVSQPDIDKFAAEADALLFYGVAHEQLAFVRHARVAYRDDKIWLDTRDFIATSTNASGHLKVDMYLKAHQIYARVRREIEEEELRRKEHEETRCMEREEQLSLRRELFSLCDGVKEELLKFLRVAHILGQSIGLRLAHTELLLADVVRRAVKRKHTRNSVNGKSSPTRHKKPRAEARHIVDFDAKRAVCGLLSSLREGEDLAFTVFMQPRGELGGDLLTIAHQLALITDYVGDVCSPSLDELLARLGAIAESDLPLSALGNFRADCSCVFDGLFGNDPVRRDDIDSGVDLVVTQANAAAPTQKPNEAVTSFQSNTYFGGFALQPAGPIEEIVIEAKSVRPDLPSSMLNALIQDMLPLFLHPKRGRKVSSVVQLHAARTPIGIIVFDMTKAGSPPSSSVSWNPRASALAQEPVAGIAVLLASGCFLHKVDSLYQSLTVSQPNALLKNPRLSSGTTRRRTVQRSKQLLPWKQFSVERMQTARRLKQQRVRGGIFLGQLEADEEREKETFAYCTTSRSHLEWKCGTDSLHKLNAIALSTLTESLRLEGDPNQPNRWKLTMRGVHQMHHLFDTESMARLLPSDDPSSELRFSHVRIEADDWQHPRRLVFSCRELQSRRQYYVDCSYAQLCRLVDNEAVGHKPHFPRACLPVEHWRALARQAASMLTFRRKNGGLSLGFTELDPNPTLAPQHDLVAYELEALAADTSDVRHDALQPISVLLDTSTAARARSCDYELKEITRRCELRRFLKHQSTARRAAAARQCAVARDSMVAHRLPLEWLRMTQEDWESQENRGLLVLGLNEIKKLKQAFEHVHQHPKSCSSRADVLCSWFMAIDKKMGSKDKNQQANLIARYEEEAAQFLSAMEAMRWWRIKHVQGERLELDVADVAEWWRRRRSSQQHLHEADDKHA